MGILFDLEGEEGRIKGQIRELAAMKAILDRGTGARELALAITKLEEARMWLAKARLLIGGEDEE